MLVHTFELQNRIRESLQKTFTTKLLDVLCGEMQSSAYGTDFIRKYARICTSFFIALGVSADFLASYHQYH